METHNQTQTRLTPNAAELDYNLDSVNAVIKPTPLEARIRSSFAAGVLLNTSTGTERTTSLNVTPLMTPITSMVAHQVAGIPNYQCWTPPVLPKKKKTRRGARKPKKDLGIFPLGHSAPHRPTPAPRTKFLSKPPCVALLEAGMDHDGLVPISFFQPDRTHVLIQDDTVRSSSNDFSFGEFDPLGKLERQKKKTRRGRRKPKIPQPPPLDHENMLLGDQLKWFKAILHKKWYGDDLPTWCNFDPQVAADRGQGLIDFPTHFDRPFNWKPEGYLDSYREVTLVQSAPAFMEHPRQTRILYSGVPKWALEELQNSLMDVGLSLVQPSVYDAGLPHTPIFEECGIAQGMEYTPPQTTQIDWTYFPDWTQYNPPPLPKWTCADEEYARTRKFLAWNCAPPRVPTIELTNCFTQLPVEDEEVIYDWTNLPVWDPPQTTHRIPRVCMSVLGHQASVPKERKLHEGDIRSTTEERVTSWWEGHIGFVEKESENQFDCPHAGPSAAYHDTMVLNLKMKRLDQLIKDLSKIDCPTTWSDLIWELSEGDDDIEWMLKYSNPYEMYWGQTGKFLSFSQNGMLRRLRNQRKRRNRKLRRAQKVSDGHAMEMLSRTLFQAKDDYRKYRRDLLRQRKRNTACGVLTCDLMYTCSVCFRCDRHDLCIPHKHHGSRRREAFRRRKTTKHGIQNPKLVSFRDAVDLMDTITRRERAERGWPQGLTFSRGMPSLSAYPTHFDVNTEMKLNIDSVTNFFTTMFPSRPGSTWKNQISAIILCVTGLWQCRDSLTQCMTHIMQYLNVLNLGPSIAEMAYNLIDTLLPDSMFGGDRGTAQAGPWDETLASLRMWIPAIAGIGSVLACLTFLRELPKGGDISELIMRFSRMGQCVTSIEKLVEYGKEVGTTVYDWVCKHVFGVDTSKCDAYRDVHDWCDEVSELNNSTFEMDIRGDYRIRSKIDTLLTKGDKILKLLDSVKADPRKLNRIRNLTILLNKMRDTAAGSGAGQFFSRVNPFILWVTGASGVGKSTIIDLLNTELLQSMGSTDPSDLGEKVYYKAPSTADEYWNGYSNQIEIVVCDDQFAQKDSEANPSTEAYEVIRMGNNAAWQLPMAHLMDKGTTFFRAKTVIWTSNRSQVKFVSLTNPEAVLRRVGMKWRQEPKPEYALERNIGGQAVKTLDPTKVHAALALDASKITEFVQFQRLDPDADTEVPIGAPVSYRVWADLIVAENAHNLRKHEGVQKIKNEFWEKSLARYHPVEEQGVAHMFQPEEEVPVVDRGIVYHTDPGMYNIGGWVHIDVLNGPNLELTDMRANGYAAAAEGGPVPDYDVNETTQCIYVHGSNAERALQAWQRATEMSGLFSTRNRTFAFNRCFYATSGLAAAEVKHCVLTAHNPIPHSERYDQMVVRRLVNTELGVFRVGRKIVKAIGNLCDWTSSLVERVAPFATWRGVLICFLVVLLKPVWQPQAYNLYSMLANLCQSVHTWIWGAKPKVVVDPTKIDPKHRIVTVDFMDKDGFKVQKKMTAETAYLLDLYADSVKAEGYEKSPISRPIVRTEAYEKAPAARATKTTETYEKAPVSRPVKTTECGDEPCDPFVAKVNGFDKWCEKWLPDCMQLTEDPLPPLGTEMCVKRLKVIDPVTRICVEGFDDEQPEKAVVPKGPAQMICDQNAAEVGALVMRNLYALEFKDGSGEWRKAMNILFIKGRIAICNRHVLTNLCEEWRIRNLSIPDGFLFNLRKLPKLFVQDDHPVHGKKDVVMFVFPDSVHQHRDIVDKFMTSDDFSRFSSLNQICLTGYRTSETIHPYSQFAQNCTAFDQTFNLVGGSGAIVGAIRRYFKYGIQTQMGDCGSIIVAYDQVFNRKIIGIHAGGTSNPQFAGVGQPVSQEFLKHLLGSIPKTRQDAFMSPDPQVIEDVKCVNEDGKLVLQLPIPGNFVIQGAAHAVHSQTRSKISPSPVWGVIATPLTKPANLGRFEDEDGQMKDPKALAQKKAAGVLPPVDTETLAECVYAYAQDVIGLKPDLEHKYDRVLTLEESIAGVEGEEFLAPINRSTSPGYGWDKTGKGKTKWLGADEYIFTNKEVLTKHAAMLEGCKNGKRPSIFWVDVLKDERRPIEKVDAGKTRLFSVGDMVFNLIFRQYFLGFAAHMMTHRIELESCIGTNVYSRDWTEIAERIQQLGTKVIAGDFSNYDGTLNSPFLWAVLDVIDAFYENATEEDRIVRRALWSEIVNSIHISGRVVYMWTHSNPSGCALTAILNSVYHSLSARYVYLLIAREEHLELATVQHYNKYVRHINYGDDDVWNISDEIIGWFNQDTIAVAYEMIGMIYTDEEKTGQCEPFRVLDEIAFLKRKFRWDPFQARWRAPLSLDTIREMPMWVRSRVDLYELTATTLEEAVHELAQHEREVFERELPRFEKARRIIAQRVACTFLSYDAYQEQEVARWCMKQASLKPRDRGFEQIAETFEAANPAEVQKPLRVYAESELFSSNDECVDSLNDRLLIRRADWCGLSSPPVEESGLAQSNNTESASITGTALGSVTEEREQLVLFHEEGDIATGGFTSSALSKFKMPAQDDLANSVIGFITRPIKYRTYEWTTAQATYTQITPGVSLPVEYTQNPMVLEKIAGFRYLRMDIELKWQVNAQPFNAGRLLMVWFPVQGQLQYAPTNQWSFSGITGYPHVELDLSNATSATLVVPFIMPVTHLDLLSGVGYMGEVRTYVYSPLTGSDNVDVTMWMRALNVDIQMPTSTSVIPPTEFGRAQAQEGDDWAGADGSVGVPDTIVETGDAPGIAVEAEASKSGVKVSRILKAGGTIAKVLGMIPTVGPFIAAAGWVAAAAGGIASLFGYSKPVDGATTTMIVPSYARNLANYGGDSKAKMLALDNRNNVAQPIGLYGTNKDEMSLSYVLQRPVYLDRFVFNKTQAQNAIIWKWPVDPAACRSQNATAAHRIKQNTLMSYLAESFQFWRGSIQYHFKIIKTVFHSGRIRVIFVPGVDYNFNTALLTFDKCYSQVYDIRELTDFCFEIPYVNNAPWKTLTPPQDIATGLAQSRNTGMLYVQVLNALRNPATAADAIEVLVETRAGSDFQFGFYGTNSELPVCYDMYVGVSPVVMDPAESGPAQSCESFFPSKKDTSFTPNQIGMGEAIVSLRQLLKRYVPEPDAMPKPAGPANATNYWPQLTGSSRMGFGSGAIGLQSKFNSSLDRFTLLYRFKSGSMRVMLQNQVATASLTTPWTITGLSHVYGNAPLVPNPTGTQNQYTPVVGINTTPGLARFAVPQQLYIPQQEYVGEYDVPYYEEYPIMLTDVGNPTYADNQSAGKVPYNSGTCLQVDNDLALVRTIIGEDFSFGYLMGAPVTGFTPTPPTLSRFPSEHCNICKTFDGGECSGCDTFKGLSAETMC
jgi:hypothetical protein